MACRLLGAKPLPELMLVHCQLDSWEQISVKIELEFCHFDFWEFWEFFWKCHVPKWQPFCPKWDELTHFEGCTKWLPFGRHCRMWLCKEKFRWSLFLRDQFTISTGSGIGLAPNRWNLLPEPMLISVGWCFLASLVYNTGEIFVAPSHYLDKCWFTLRDILWHSHDWKPFHIHCPSHLLFCIMSLKIILFKLLPRGVSELIMNFWSTVDYPYTGLRNKLYNIPIADAPDPGWFRGYPAKKGPICHAWAWRVGSFWQDTLDLTLPLRGIWGRLNIKMVSYQYKNSHYKTKTVAQLEIYNGNPHTWKDCPYIETRPCTILSGI